MRAGLCVALALAAAALALPGASAGRTTEEERAVYLAYANIRSDLYDCQLSRVQGTLTREEKRSCKRLNRRYRLFAWPGEGRDFQVHCLTQKCIETPSGEPAADGPIPEGATVYRWPGATASRHRHHRHRARRH